ncbi:flagellar hook-length control protein FliK [Hydrogenophaga sp. SL48]|uniref:flagellar hook-length control protein FliK n=1 Tax=Hydrogenophaga sp. SL48 TaxID=2806347 RepID=UPI001F39414B|nr:flagellar hook-length control protein FliK [Hydrogenophaga sp. SL48]UJW81312.1 flagellar hook-length control protein FliK [Hydrogenophaga sp. SL48]
MTSTTSTTQSHSAQTAAARAQAANPRKPGAGGHGQEASPDLFAAMLSLLSATPDIPPDLPPDTAADDTDPQALSAHDLPTDHLLGWSGAAGTGPLTSSASAPAAALNGTALPPTGTPPLAAEAPGAAPTGVDLQGMQRLEQPAAPDEQTLAALARGEGEARATPPHPATTESPVAPPATRPTAWRSTVSSATTTSVQQQHASQNLSHSLSERLQVRLETFNPVALRSTVTLDDRFNQAAVGDTPTPSAGFIPHGQGSASGAGGFAGEQPGTGGDAGQDHQTALSGDSDTSTDSHGFDEALTDQDAEEALGAWSSPTTLRQASLRVGDGGEEAIDIQLSMSGQELNVAFRTDNAEARAELRENAGESLADLLQRSGIQLGDVSVGAQGQHPGRGDPGEPRPQPATAPRNGSTTATATPAPAAVSLRPRSDGSRPLDMFV